jgi:methylmalonyl-CoA mutase cobalamin-binding subunit
VTELFTTDKTGLEFCRRAVRDVGDIVDAAGQPVAWDETVKAALFARVYVVEAIALHYWRAVHKVKSGN